MKYLLDTDFVISLHVHIESTHTEAHTLMSRIDLSDLYYLDLVHFEVATVMSRKYGHLKTSEVLNQVDSLPARRISYNAYESEIWQEFKSHQRKSVSYTDCANIVLARKLDAHILSFDAAYPADLLVSDGS